MKNKILSLVMTSAMFLSSFSIAFAESEAGEGITTDNPAVFNDVNEHWAKTAIYKWSGNGIINGYQGLFRPNDSITRGEMAVILDNMMDYQVAAKNTFADLKAEQFYTDAVLKANEAGILKGDGNTVRPTDKITREEAVVMLARAFAVKESTSSIAAFNDASSISSWAKGYVTQMEAKGFINGSNNNFMPKTKITRAEIVTIIDNIVKAYYTKAGTYTEDVNGTAVIKVSDVTLKGVTIQEDLIIAEGVGQGDVTLDSVTVKGDTVVRGGGENSVHIVGTSNITNVRIEKVDGKIRIVVSDGNTVEEIEIAEGEEIIITGTVGIVDVEAPNTTIIADGAIIESANISGSDSTIIVNGGSRVGPVNIASTGTNFTIQTERGAVVGTVTANATTTITGNGSVPKVTLNDGADNSSITTPNTQITVGAGVTGATGAGGTEIPSGRTGTNNSPGNNCILDNKQIGDRGRGGSPTVAVSAVTVVDQNIVEVTMAQLNDVTFTWNGLSVAGLYETNKYILTVPGTKETGNILVVSAIGYKSKTNSVDFSVPVWDGVSRAYGWYTASAGDNYLISTPSDLAGLASVVIGISGDGNPEKTNFKDKTIILLNNLDLNNEEWTPIGTSDGTTVSAFSGTFDGNEKNICGLSITGSKERIGLFGYNKGTIKKITVSGNVTGLSKVGGVAGVNDRGTISDCINNVAITGSSTNIGGVCGSNVEGIIENCTNNGAISSTVTNEFTNAQAGGIVGYNSGTIRYCSNTNTVTSGGQYMGGIAAVNYGTIKYCKNHGNVSGGLLTGGITGMGGMTDDISADILNCSNSGEVNGTIAVGGIVGQQNLGIVTGCYNNNKVKGTETVGGIIGGNDENRLENCYNTGEIESLGDYVGGIVGGNAGSLKNCYNTGIITAPITITLIGAISGNNDTIFASFFNCYFLSGSCEFGLGGETTGSSPVGETEPVDPDSLKHLVLMLNEADLNGPWRIGGSENNGYPVLAWAYPNAKLPD